MIQLFQPDVAWCAPYVHDQVASGMVGPGMKVAEFERLLAETVGVKYAICTTSGTTALMLALMACEVEQHHTVAFPAYGMLAGANAARLLGAHTRLVDVCESGVMDWPYTPTDPDYYTKACIVISHNGHWISPESRPFLEARGVRLIEDACQSLGIQQAGTIGRVACFSFSPQKIVTTGQGGAVVTNDIGIAERVRRLIDHGGGWRNSRVYQRIGGNFRMSDVAAALGVPQLKRLSALIERRMLVRQWYRKYLPQISGNDAWMVVFKSRDAAALVAHLKDRHIGASQLYPPVSWSAPYKTGTAFPVAEEIHRTWVYLPSHLRLGRDEVKYIAESILEVERGEPEEDRGSEVAFGLRGCPT